MRQNVSHGILLDAAFYDNRYPESFSRFARKSGSGRGLFGIIVPREKLEYTIHEIQDHMRSDAPFYNHLYDNEELIVVFKKRIFRATCHSSGWQEIVQYGLSIHIPVDQLDFWPNRFQDKIHYFSRDDFVIE